MFDFIDRPAGDKRRYKRRDCVAAAVLQSSSGKEVAGQVRDVSLGGFRFFSRAAPLFIDGGPMSLSVDDLTIDCAVVRKQGAAYHCRFAPALQASAIALYLLYPHKTERARMMPLADLQTARAVHSKFSPR